MVHFPVPTMAASYAAALTYFKEGTEVEVTSANHCDRGALFLATIIGPKPQTKQFIVEYKTLKDMRDRLVPLKEAVNWALVRPRQPEETDHDFEFGESVDVFLDGGWWEGAITEVLENSMYMVFLRFSRQQQQIRKSRMRVHREWFNGIWKPPLEEEVSSSKIDPSPTEEFGKGMHVEIRINEDGFQGSWFAATIVKATRDDKFLVEYHSLRTEDDSGLLREEVDTQNMRPMPPELIVVDGFTENEEVDALYNDGWWEGVITKILHGSRCRVYFKLTDDEMVFHQSKLRPHQNWIDGDWIIPSRV